MSDTLKSTKNVRIAGLSTMLVTVLAILKVAAVGHFGTVPWIWVFLPMWLPVVTWAFFATMLGLFVFGVMGVAYLLDRAAR